MAGLYKNFKGTDSSVKKVLKDSGFSGKKYVDNKGKRFVGHSKSKALDRMKEVRDRISKTKSY